ncbi:MAG: hypothetical protein ACRDVC_05095 [Acidimicrobiales bacterium]
MRQTNSQIRPFDLSAPDARSLFAPGVLSFWQAAIRTTDDSDRPITEEALKGSGCYSGDSGAWYPSVVRHWISTGRSLEDK